MVENGEMTDFAEEPNDQKNDLPVDPYARTCVGIREDGSVFFITIDGKRPDTYSAGLSLVEMAQLMIENGAETAMNLDGGGSATMVIKDPETKEYTVKNSPSDGTSGPTGGTERSVANSLYIYNDDETGLPSIISRFRKRLIRYRRRMHMESGRRHPRSRRADFPAWRFSLPAVWRNGQAVKSAS